MNTENGHLSLLVSIMLGIFSWFTQNVDLKTIGFIGTLIASAMAVINYYYSIKKNRLEIKQMEKASK